MLFYYHYNLIHFYRLKKSLAPPREYSGHEYELYHVRKQQNTSNRRPGRFTTCRAIFVDFRGFSFPAKIRWKGGGQQTRASIGS